MKYIFIINKTAGKVDMSGEIKKKLNNMHEYYETKSKGDATDFVANYKSDETCCFVACGGDGTINEVSNGVIKRGNSVLAFMPCGSGNDLVRSLGNDTDFMDIDKLTSGTVCHMDAIKYNDKYIINLFNIGLDATVAKNMVKFKNLPLVSGSMAYNLSIVYSIFGKISTDLKIKIDDEDEVKANTIITVLANGSYYGGGYFAAPKAKINDGLMDFCMMKSIPRLKIAKILGIYKKGQHLEKAADLITYKQIKKVHITADKEFTLAIDGEILSSKDVCLEIIPSALKLLVPKGIEVK